MSNEFDKGSLRTPEWVANSVAVGRSDLVLGLQTSNVVDSEAVSSAAMEQSRGETPLIL